ncbi:hypothetical protein KC19_8G084800 [Ceratodon purpureus]|uniref:Fe2OG dioxygenase domain-containing protein n=1 Tax=Ceratodon purpureus TaxID=3225 RepID=A0A8T0H4S5_CERPU|nr:hypothetical protein KC19_8G084800 [Ceratodon purpureus]
MGVPEESAKQTQSERPELYNGLTRVQHMVEKGVSAVPEAFIQPPHMRSSARSLNCDLQIPVIDMALLQQGGEGKMQVQADITHACEEWGFFRKFFALSPEEKEMYKHQPSGGAVGYGRVFEEYRKPDEVKEWLDRLTLDLSSAKDPSQTLNLVINNPPRFQDVYEEFGNAIYELGKKLMAIISEELGQAPDFLLSKSGNEKLFMRTMFNYYPPCPHPELVMGSPPHSDGSALTILQQGDVPGLQVLHNGVWVPIPPTSHHAFVVNMGDVLQVICRFTCFQHS